MPITVWSINMRRCFDDAGPDTEARTLTWLKSLADPATPIPDVLCLCDFRIELAPYLWRLPNLAFAAMTDHLIWGQRQLVGIAIASRHRLVKVHKTFTYGDGVIRPLQGVDDKNHRFDKPGVDDVVNASEARRFIAVSAVCDSVEYRIATTHGFWTRGGVPTIEQDGSTARLAKDLLLDSAENDGTVLTADLNLDRNGVAYDHLVRSGGRDHLPPDIKTTLASTHPAAKFGAKPDRIMQWPNAQGDCRYEVSDVHMDDAPGSDHLMLCATVSRA